MNKTEYDKCISCGELLGIDSWCQSCAKLQKDIFISVKNNDVIRVVEFDGKPAINIRSRIYVAFSDSVYKLNVCGNDIELRITDEIKV